MNTRGLAVHCCTPYKSGLRSVPDGPLLAHDSLPGARFCVVDERVSEVGEGRGPVGETVGVV